MDDRRIRQHGHTGPNDGGVLRGFTSDTGSGTITPSTSTAGTGTSANVAEDGTTVVTAPTTVDFRHGLDVTNPGGGPARVAVDETELVLESLSSTDITTGNASTSKHGLLRKLDNDALHFLNGTGAWADPVDVRLVTVAATGATETINVSDARTYDITLDANCTLTLSGATTGQAWFVTLLIRQDGVGGRTISWPGSVAWLGGVAPTLQTAAAAVDVVTLMTLNGGTTWLGFPAGAGGGSSVGELDDLTDVTITSPAEGHELKYRSGVWVNEVPVAPRWELVVTGSSPPVPMTLDDGTDFIYAPTE